MAPWNRYALLRNSDGLLEYDERARHERNPSDHEPAREDVKVKFAGGQQQWLITLDICTGWVCALLPGHVTDCSKWEGERGRVARLCGRYEDRTNALRRDETE